MLSGISADLGPSDGTVIVTPCTGNWSVSLSTIGGNLEEVVNSVNSEMTKFGSVRYSRAVRNTIWTQYREGGAALTALTARNITVLGVEWDITSCTSDWRQSLASELAMVSNPVLPLAPPPGQQFKKESAKLLSQLSQLSFEELKEVTLNLDVAPVKPPPPSRPAAPPCRPPPPSKPPPPTTIAPVNEDKTTPESPAKPAKPSGPPPRPKPPPARPPPPPAPAAKPSSPEPPAPAAPSSPPAAVKSGGGFSDLFSAPPDPDLDSDIPLSLSSDSLATAGSGEATPAPTKPPLPAVDSETQESEVSEAPVSKSPVEEESDSDSSDSDNSDSDSEESGASTPTNDERQAPPPPSRPAPPPSSRPPPPGPPPRVPGRPAGGPPAPVPKR